MRESAIKILREDRRMHESFEFALLFCLLYESEVYRLSEASFAQFL